MCRADYDVVCMGALSVVFVLCFFMFVCVCVCVCVGGGACVGMLTEMVTGGECMFEVCWCVCVCVCLCWQLFKVNQTTRPLGLLLNASSTP